MYVNITSNGVEVRKKRIQRFGRGIGLYLSELQKLGLTKGDSAYVSFVDDRIVISSRPETLVKPTGIDDDIWHTFLTISQMKKKTQITNEDIAKNINDALKLWIEEQRTIFKIEIPILKKTIPKNLNMDSKE